MFFEAEVLADEPQAQQLLLHSLDVKAGCVVAVVVLDYGKGAIALSEVLVVVEVAGVAGYSVVVAHVDGLGHFLARDECFVQFLAVTRAYDLDLCLAVARVDLRVQLLEGLGKGGESGGRGFLYE